MIRLPWSVPTILVATLAAAACGSGESKPSPSTDGKDSGAGGGSSGGATGSGAAGSGAAGNGGSGNTDSGAGGSVTPGDTTPPTFAGITGVLGAGQDRATVTWEAATDDETPGEQVAYRVYRSPASGDQDFTRARRCGTVLADTSPTAQASLPCYVTTPAGATSALVIDALPAHQFFYVVRAVDAAGNEDTNTVEMGLTTDDETGPEFGGVNGARILSARSIEVDWGAAYDLAAPDSELTFQVFVQADGEPAPTEPVHTSAPGEHRAVISALEPRTTYTVWVRAVDPSANPGGGDGYKITITTPEGVPPTFSGVLRADAKERSILLLWPFAIDNGTPSASIVYDIWSSESDAVSARDLTGPPRLTSPAGATSIRIEEPEENTRYSYVVRARDVAGNRDSNTKQVFIVTGSHDVTPPVFAGVSTVATATPTSLRVTWNAANDAATTQADFTYRVYVSATSPVPTTTPALTVRGALSAVVGGLTPDSPYFVAVRAVDRAGLVDEASPLAERTATTSAQSATDTTPPVLGGAHTVALLPAQPRRLRVTWPAATDDAAPADAGVPSGQVRYHVCVATTAAGCQDAQFKANVAATTAVGALSATIDFLTPRTVYFVGLRAEDANGNFTTGGTVASESTATSWATNVFPIIAERCFACHTTYDRPATIVNVKGALNDDAACPTPNVPTPSDPPGGDPLCQLDIVEPFHPKFSILFRKVNLPGLNLPPFETAPNRFDGLQMPTDSSGTLNAEQIDSLHDWIVEGALGN